MQRGRGPTALLLDIERRRNRLFAGLTRAVHGFAAVNNVRFDGGCLRHSDRGVVEKVDLCDRAVFDSGLAIQRCA